MMELERNDPDRHRVLSGIEMLVHCREHHPDVYSELVDSRVQDPILERFDFVDCPCATTRSLFCCDCGKLLYAMSKTADGCSHWTDLNRLIAAPEN
jgi:hypothetical protein